jgi:hypothetical protein
VCCVVPVCVTSSLTSDVRADVEKFSHGGQVWGAAIGKSPRPCLPLVCARGGGVSQGCWPGVMATSRVNMVSCRSSHAMVRRGS